MPSVLILPVDPIACNLEGLRPSAALPSSDQNSHSAVLDSGIHRPLKKSLQLLRARRACDIPVLRRPSEKTVPHTAPDGIGLKAGALQSSDDSPHPVRKLNPLHHKRLSL